MARPNYRRRKGGTITHSWHFCSSCKEWPVDNYETSSTPGEPLCSKCLDLEKRQICT